MSTFLESKNKEKKSELTKEFLEFSELKRILKFLESKKTNLNLPESLLDKLSKLSLKPESIFVALLYFLYKDENHFPNDLKDFMECEHKSFFLKSMTLYKKLIKVNQFTFQPKNHKQVELTLRMFLTVLADLQLLTVFLVLQLHKLEKIESFPSKKKDEIAWVALNIYAPLAGRLGIFWIKSELEDRAFRHLEYESYQDLKKKIARKRSTRSESVEKIISKIKKILNKAGIENEVEGRYKRFYSIFQKLEKVENNFDRIQDLIAFRIVVKKIDDCYAALSFIHDNWTPIKKRFKDYIVKPKSNGYQSLHTTVKEVFEDSLGLPITIEIQIRTNKMHRMAEYGVAAHWIYKEKRKDLTTIDQKMRMSLSRQSKSFNDNRSIPLINLYKENIYVMTPTKEIKELPKDATPIDFAYSIHTDVGNKTTGAKVNGKIIRLDGVLESGDILEIFTSPRQEPRKEWLELVKTRHARNKINHALHEQNREARRKKGLEILEKEFRDNGLNLNRLVKEGKMEHFSRHKKNQDFEHILFCIGEGTIKTEEILGWFHIIEKKIVDAQIEPKFLKKEKTLKEKNPNTKPNKNLILVDGMKNVMTRIARCCSPEEKQPIKGYLTKEKVVSVHKEMCPFLMKLKPERIIKVNWSNNS